MWVTVFFISGEKVIIYSPQQIVAINTCGDSSFIKLNSCQQVV